MKNKAILLLVYGFVSGLFTEALAQSRQDTGAVAGRALQIGDAIPEELWNLPLQVVNHPEGKNTITLNGYRNVKPIVMKFWASWCGASNASLPALLEMKERYGADVHILPVSMEDTATIADFARRREANRPGETGICSATGLRSLKPYFPHRVLPHFVWIDGKGTFMGTSDASQFGPANLEGLLAGTLRLRNKVDSTKPHDIRRPMLGADNGLSPASVQGYSVFGGYEKHLTPRMASHTHAVDGRLSKLTFANIALQQMLLQAFSRNDLYFPPNRLLVRTRDTSFLHMPEGEAERERWKQQHYYCYETVGEGTSMDLRRQMQQDLARYLPQYRAYTAMVDRTCWVMKVQSEEMLAKHTSKGGAREKRMDAQGAVLVNSPVFDLFYDLNRFYFQNSDMPLVNEVGSAGNIDMALSCNMSDIASINNALQAYGLVFVREERPVEMIVLEDSGKGGQQ